jgi:hypothetical protein
MKHQTKNTLRALAKHIGLKIEFVHYLAGDVYGKLIPREKCVLVNAKRPRYEHIFTVLHEIGHHICHVQNQNRKHYPQLLDRDWRFDGFIWFVSRVKRSMRFWFAKTSGKEWEADLWAFCAFIYFARHLGCRDDLMIFLEHHPEKSELFMLAMAGTLYSDIKTFASKTKTRLQNFPETHLAPLLLK